MSDKITKPIPDHPLYNAIRSGHERRKGHKLEGYMEDGGDKGSMFMLVRTCCENPSL